MISDPVERRLHPAGIAIAAIRHASGTWFIAVAIIAGAGPTVGLPLVIGGVGLLAALAYVEWRVTRYAIVDGGLRYRSGVFARREVDIPASRISALDTTRGILQRIFGVVALQVQTPGGGGKAELTLHAVSLVEAERLRRELGHRGAERAPAAATSAQAGGTADDAAAQGAPHRPAFIATGTVPDEEMETVFTLSARDLLLAGLTSPSGAVVGAIFAAMYGPLQDVLGESAQRSVESGVADAAAGASTAFLIILGVLVLLGIAVVSVLATALQFANFKVTRDDRRLRVRRGLITERTGTVQLDRIHALRIVETPIRQALGYVSVQAEVAGWGREDDAVKAIAPFVRREALPDLLPRLVPGFAWPLAALEPPPPRATRRYVVRAAWLPALVAIALIAAPFGWWGAAGATLLLAGGCGLGIWRARSAGVLLDDRRVVLRSRGIARQTVVTLIDRLQQRGAQSSPFQRRARLATLSVHLSSRRTVSVAFLDAAEVSRVLALLQPRVARVGAAADADR